MVERSGSVTDVAGSFLHHLQDICGINVKAEFLKVPPPGSVMMRQRSAQSQAWEPGRVWGWFSVRSWVSCSTGSWNGALWGSGGRAGKRKAWRTHWITTCNNVAWLCKQHQTGQTCMQKKNQRLSDSFWASVSGSLQGGKARLQVQYALQTEERVPAQRLLPCVWSVEKLRHVLGSSATFSPLESDPPPDKSPI